MVRQIREANDLSTTEVADRLGWSQSKVSRVERGAAPVSPAELVRYAARCGAELSDVDRILDWCQEVVPPGYWLANNFASLIFHESTAAFSTSWCPLVVHGLLQTQEYATALLAQARLEPKVAKFMVGVRMMRQEMLHSRPFEFFIHEQALRLRVGDNQVMNEQMLKLVLLANQPRITIRVIPMAVGERGMFGSSFELFRYTGGGPLVYLEVKPEGLFVEDRSYVANYHALLADMSEVALGRGESREMFAELASAFDQPEDAPDDPDHLAEEQLQREPSDKLR